MLRSLTVCAFTESTAEIPTVRSVNSNRMTGVLIALQYKMICDYGNHKKGKLSFTSIFGHWSFEVVLFRIQLRCHFFDPFLQVFRRKIIPVQAVGDDGEGEWRESFRPGDDNGM